MSFAGKWMKLEIILLSKINQAQKAKYCTIALFCRTRSKIVATMMLVGQECIWGAVCVCNGRQEGKGYKDTEV
jgi:hypothetical protein